MQLNILDASGRPSFHLLQNSATKAGNITFYAFDLPMWKGQDLQARPLEERRELLESKVISTLSDPIRFSHSFAVSAEQMNFGGAHAGP